MRATRRTSRPSSLARALLAVLALSARAHAEEEPIDLVYRAYDGCPSERQFVEMVVGRAAKTLVVSERTRGRKFYVTVAQQRRDALGKLEIATGNGSATREVRGANCGEVVSALALFTALAIDPSAKMDPAPAPRPEEPKAPADAKPEPKLPPPEVAAPTAPPIERDVVRGPARESAKHGSEVLVGARALADGAFAGGSVTPVWARGAGFFVQWTTPGYGAYRAGGTYFAETDDERATFQFVAGRADGCPLDVRLAPSLVLEPCLAMEIGRVTATSKAGSELAPTTERRWWVAGDLLARARFAPIPWIFAEIEAGASVPFTRYNFLLRTPNDVRAEVHQVPPVGWVLGFGLGARIL